MREANDLGGGALAFLDVDQLELAVAAEEARTLVTGETGTAIGLTLERGVTVTVVLVKS